MLLPTLALLLPAAEEPVDFNRDVRPLLADRCLACHGPDEAQRKGSLRLDTALGGEGAYQVIEPGAPERSELLARITSDDPGEVMPPPDAHVEPLDSSEVALLRRWISEGADYEEHWAFAPPEAAAERDLDRLVRARLGDGQPSPRADRRTLARRLHLDLTGLPPSRAELTEFLADDQPGAYERLVDRLLASPRYGEHMARYWLDLVRFADTNGVHHDHYRELSPYRDWVIRAFNDNQPFDAFLVDQLAGDLHPEPSTEQLVASGFNRLHRIIDRGTMLPEESYARNVLDRTTAVGTVMLGLTAQCAVCHDHKYDPLTQRDFYRLSAFFNSFDGAPETGSTHQDKLRGLQPPYIELPSEEQAARLSELEAALAAAAEEEPRKQADQALKEFRRGVPAAMVMRDRAEPRPAHILLRGEYDNPGEQVERGTPAFLPPLLADGAPTRMDLARWLVAPGHPLTARVAVNRFWQQLFGVGLVKTSEDLGVQGEYPSHPRVLDELAVGFVESGWDVKGLLRRLVLSDTYQQASAAAPAAFRADPENRLLARGARFRLDAEVVRDQILAATGLLNLEMYGTSVKPPQPAGVWEAVTLPSSYPRNYQADTGEKIVRRSLYTFWKRAMPPPQMTILNAPSREECTARRERTNTPQQALLLLNEPEYLRAAGHLAERLLELPEPGQRVEVLFETLTSRLPDEQERATLLTLAQDLQARYAEAPDLATQLAEGNAELAAWTLVVNAVLNLDVTKTRQ